MTDTPPTPTPDEPVVAMTVRLPEQLHQDLELAATLDDLAIAAAIRSAVVVWLTERRRDPAFQAALRRRVQALRRLADPSTRETPPSTTASNPRPSSSPDPAPTTAHFRRARGDATQSGTSSA